MSRYYDTALAELDDRRPKPGLWARALAECFDDATKARQRYIKLRIEEMRREVADAKDARLLEEESRQRAELASAGPSLRRVVVTLLIVFSLFAAATMIDSLFLR